MLIGDIVVIGDVAHIAAGNFTEESGAYIEVDVSDPADSCIVSHLRNPGPSTQRLGDRNSRLCRGWQISRTRGPVRCWCSICGPPAIPRH